MTREIEKAGAGFVGPVGVQSNQFPRAVDIGRQFRAAGDSGRDRRIPRSGCISMAAGPPA
jgi:hypothetical protein